MYLKSVSFWALQINQIIIKLFTDYDAIVMHTNNTPGFSPTVQKNNFLSNSF